MSKADRVRAAQEAEIQRIARRAISVTVAVLRAKILREALQPALDRLAATNRRDDDLRAEAADAALQLQPTDGSRIDSLYSFYLGALYAVVEKWRDWKFKAPSVDNLLADSERVRLLKKHRHAIFHADDYDHKDVAALAERHDMFPWADDLQEAIERFFAEWHTDPEVHVNEYLRRSGA